MRRTVTRIAGSVALALGLVISPVGATAVMAQGQSSPFEQILAALSSVQESVTALSATTNVRFSPAVIVESGIVDCIHVNVTNADRHVLTQLINAATGTVASEAAGTIATAPGRARGVGAIAPGGFTGFGFCKFTVLDGTKADIRAALNLTRNTAGDETTAVSVPAE